MISRINYNAIYAACKNIGLRELEEYVEISDQLKSNETFLRSLHHVLFEINIVDGFLICPTTGRKFPIKDGIPNMLLHEDEV
jgi:multifunctional methyltransferase subunit TRM112